MRSVRSIRMLWRLADPKEKPNSVGNQKQYRELTWLSVVLAMAVGAVLNVGICYAGLQIGFTIVGSTVAAVIGFGILRGLIGLVAKNVGSILEVNIFQTVASAVNTVNAGIIFTVPVLFLLGMEEQINYPALIMAASAGSLLGVVMIIPLRKQIIDLERLRFPEGVAVAAILKSPGAGVQKALLLLIGILVSMIVATLTKVGFAPESWALSLSNPLLPDHFNLGESLGLPAGFRLVFALSLLSLGAGYLAGKHGLAILYGTILNFWILIPLCIWLGWVPEKYADFTFASTDYEKAELFSGAFAHFTSRNLGIGMILGGAVAGIVIALPALKAAIATLKAPAGEKGREELSLNVVNIGLAVGFVLLLLSAKYAGGDDLSWGTAFAVAVAGSIWLWLAGLVVAQTTGRTDWSPLSGLALIAIAIMMGIMGTEDKFVVPAVTIGAAICVATSMCADMMADLKTGYLVGGKPIKQQLAQVATCWIGPTIALGTVILLWNAYAFGPEQARILYERDQIAAVEAGPAAVVEFEASERSPELLPPGIPRLGAPQAGALQAAIGIVQSGDIALGKYMTGAGLGAAISILVSPGLGVMIGLSLYLPFMYMIVFGLGGVTNILLTRLRGARWAEDKGVPVAAGLIVGDALIGIVFAVIEVVKGASS
jgi:putative OPT family oligopeptide transporter